MYQSKTRCLVCRQLLNDYDPGRSIDDEVEASQGMTVKACIERVLAIEVINSTLNSICTKCYADLEQIESYYLLVEDFRARYRKGLADQTDSPTKSTFSTETVPRTNPLMIPTVEGSMLLQSNQPSFDLLGIELQPASQAFLSPCYEGNPELVQDDEQRGERTQGKSVYLEGDGALGHKAKSQPVSTEVDPGNLMKGNNQVGFDENDDDGNIDFVDLTEEGNESDEVSESGKMAKEKFDGRNDEMTTKRATRKAMPANTMEFPCDICGKVFNTDKRLRRHMISHTGNRPYKCMICGQGFDTEKSMSIHSMTHAIGEDMDSKPSSSDVPELNNEVEGLNDKKEDHEGSSSESPLKKVQNKCILCSQSFTKIKDLRLHKNQVHGKNAFLICPDCGSQFMEASELRTHLISHCQESRWRCHICGIRFRRESKLRDHLDYQCSGKKFTCKLCYKGFQSNMGLTNHIRIHTGEKPYECNYCKKKFNNSSNFKAHLRIHTGETPFKCSICNMAFTQSGQRNKHEQCHAEEPTYSCDHCGKGFYYTAALRKHVRIHSDVKTHLCSLCGKSFRETAKLTTHMRTHSEDRPYKCSYCEKGFKTSKHKKVHERIHTGERPYICHICGRGFTQATGLKFHLKTH